MIVSEYVVNQFNHLPCMSIISQLHKLIAERPINSFCARQWLKTAKVEVYVRITQRYDGGYKLESIDIANINITNATDRGQGWFKKFITQVEDTATKSGRSVYVENVSNERLAHFLINRGYTESTTSKNSYFKPPQTTTVGPIDTRKWDRPTAIKS